MTLSVNTASYYQNGIDNANVANISSQILQRAKTNSEKQVNVQLGDLSKFNRATLGIDLYSSRTSPDMQKQIALVQKGLFVQSVNVAKLNAQAANNLYSALAVRKNVELTQSVQTSELNPELTIKSTQNNIQLFNMSDKNSNSSNGFNPFKTNDDKKINEENIDKDKTINIFI